MSRHHWFLVALGCCLAFTALCSQICSHKSTGSKRIIHCAQVIPCHTLWLSGKNFGIVGRKPSSIVESSGPACSTQDRALFSYCWLPAGTQYTGISEMITFTDAGNILSTKGSQESFVVAADTTDLFRTSETDVNFLVDHRATLFPC